MKNKSFGAAIASALLVLLAGCVSKTAKLDRVEDGMTKAEVFALLGAPDSSHSRGKVEYLTYYFTADSTIGEQPYMIRLLNQRVDTVGRFVQLPPAKGKDASKVGIGAILPSEMTPTELARAR